MLEFFLEYGAFLLKAATILVMFLLAVVFLIGGLRSTDKQGASGNIKITSLNKKLKSYSDNMRESVMEAQDYKKFKKEQKNKEKAKAKARKKKHKQSAATSSKARVFVLDFNGDIKASELELLREEISAVLTLANKYDEVVIRLESPGGMVHSYGLSASQLLRIKDKQIPLTICVDKVAASGGYMMACVADKIVAAPFAVLGSIGVVAQIPNFNRVLKKNDVDYELITAGKYKRTLTMFGENTPKGRKKFQQDIEETHDLFKSFVSENRAIVNIEKVANGDIWYGKRALDVKLVDELKTSDQYLEEACEDKEVYEVSFALHKNLAQRLGFQVQNAVQSSIERLWNQIARAGFFHQ